MIKQNQAHFSIKSQMIGNVMKSAMKFNRVPNMLKRYSFREKVRVCQFCSRLDLIDKLNGTPIHKNNRIKPWDLEVFFKLASEASEYHEDVFLENDGRLLDIAAAIYHKRYLVIQDLKSSLIAKTDLIFTNELLTQSHYMMDDWQLLYRYNWAFNFSDEVIDMNEEFLSMFKCEYRDFLEFGSCCLLMLLQPLGMSAFQHILAVLTEKYKNCAKALVISRVNIIS